MLHINQFPMETIETVLAFLLVVWSIITMIPWNSTGDYGSSFIARLIFGGIMLEASLPLLLMRRKGMEYYDFLAPKRRRYLFMSTIVWLYISVLRAIVVSPLIPPIFIMYAALGLFNYICYLRLS